MKEAEEARTLKLSIEGMECSGELMTALEGHANTLTELYRKIHGLIVQGVDTMESYQVHVDQAAALKDWFKSRKKVAQSMKSASAAASTSGN